VVAAAIEPRSATLPEQAALPPLEPQAQAQAQVQAMPQDEPPAKQ